MIWSQSFTSTRTDNGTVALGHFDRDNALRRTRLGRVLNRCGTLPVAVLRCQNSAAFAAWMIRETTLSSPASLISAHTGRGTPHRTDGVFFEAHHFTRGREQHDFVRTRSQVNANQLVAVVEAYRDNTGGTRTAEFGQRRFHGTAGGRHKDVDAFVPHEPAESR